MAWIIDCWSTSTGSGTIRSPHFDPIPFDATANIDRVSDFMEGETVLVELEGEPPDLRVVTVRPTHQRQPPGTQCPALEGVHGGDALVEESSSGSLQLWVGDCCEDCTPNPTRVRFDGVTSVSGLDDDVDFCDPVFRLASAAEVKEHGVVVPPGATAFCIVTSHGEGRDGPAILVVASSVQVHFTDADG